MKLPALPGWLFGSLRYRLLALVLVPLILLTGSVIVLAARWTSDYTYQQLFTKVNTDLRVAHHSFERIRTERLRELVSLGTSSALLRSMESDDLSVLPDFLETQRVLGKFDFLNLFNAEGTSRLDADGWQPHALKQSRLSEALLSSPQSSHRQDELSGIEIYTAEEWGQEQAIRAATVVLPLVETPRASPTHRTHEDRAMLIRTLHAVRNRDGQRIAVLEGGVLLNRNFDFVDEIRDLVYGPGSLAPGSRGTVTVFVDDVRITTNVPTSEDTRALGTRVSAEVRAAVLTRGESWIDRAFVVNDWYISAYEPIMDVRGERVGMLYAGYLEAPFRTDLLRAISLVTVLVLAGSLLAAAAAVFGVRSVFSPIESMTRVVRAVSRGENRRIGELAGADEITELAARFDTMLDALEQHRAQIQKDALGLEDKVAMRTRELEQKNHSLQESIDLLHKTRQQLAMAEKLAVIGELTAGVAHEINNPTAVILGNMDILIEEIGSARAGVQNEIDLVIEQVYRIRSITDRLLQYSRTGQSRPGELTENPIAEPLALDAAVMDTLLLVQHELSTRRIRVRENYAKFCIAAIDRQEFQQIMVNLIMNAAEAMADGGEIEISTHQLGQRRVSVRVHDDGPGIEAENLQRLFDPFYTSGKKQGTGLGLSVSYGIVRRYGGQIDVESTPGEGATFFVTLPDASPVAATAGSEKASSEQAFAAAESEIQM